MATSSAGVLSATARLHTAFGKPIHQRCLDITKIIQDTSIKELHTVVPLLLESIFGFNNQLGWGIGRLSKNHYQEFNTLRRFLSPHGQLLDLIHKLLLDPYCRYEFPFSCIPYPSRHTLEEGAMCAFYANKVQFHHGHGRPYSMLTLNAFELYFFHFSYFLVNPNSQKISSWNSPSDALYPVLLEDYLNYYLPADGARVPPIPHMAQPIRSPVAHQSPIHRQQGISSPAGTPGRLNFSGLLRTSFSYRAASPQPTPPPVGDHGDQEIWRSQTFLEIIVEFWLNQNTVENNKYAFSQQVSPHGSVQGHPPSNKIDPYYYIMVESFLPSGDHVRIVRMLVKHLHFFANGVHIEAISSPYSSPVVSPLDDLKRQVWPQLLQKRLYAFLRHGFERWPLDSSFRLMLETWLSFIQPWRYTDITQQSAREREVDKDKKIDEKWSQFVADNLLFYTILFQEFLPRVFRMDLCAAKNAYMLFRVSKVLNLTYLRNMIEEAETALYEPVQRVTMARVHPSGSTDLGGSYLSPAHNPANRAAMLNLQFSELESPGFVYKPFFSDHTYRQVIELLGLISQAKQAAQLVQQKNAENGGGSFWSWLGGSGVDYNTCTYAGYESYDDFGGGDSRKIEHHLDQATTNLCSIFQLQVPEDVKTVRWGTSSTGPAKLETLAPDYVEDDEGPHLTPLGRYQMVNGLRKFDVQYRGDPDLQPIRSYENTFLVRMLYQLSSFLNHKYSHEIERLYHRDDFLGRLAYQYFSAPQTSRSSPKPPKGSVPSPTSREQRTLLAKPRVSLRWLASYQNLGYIAAFYLMAYLWLGTGSVGCLLLLVLAGLFYGLLMTVLSPKEKFKRN